MTAPEPAPKPLVERLKELAKVNWEFLAEHPGKSAAVDAGQLEYLVALLEEAAQEIERLNGAADGLLLSGEDLERLEKGLR